MSIILDVLMTSEYYTYQVIDGHEWGSWIGDSASWMRTSEWLKEGEAESVLLAARKLRQQTSTR